MSKFHFVSADWIVIPVFGFSAYDSSVTLYGYIYQYFYANMLFSYMLSPVDLIPVLLFIYFTINMYFFINKYFIAIINFIIIFLCYFLYFYNHDTFVHIPNYTYIIYLSFALYFSLRIIINILKNLIY